MDLEDLNLSGRVVRVRGKGGKERLVPFNRTRRRHAADDGRSRSADSGKLESQAPETSRSDAVAQGGPSPHAVAASRCS